MKKTLHSALSLMMCLSLLITGLLPALAADGAYLPEEAPTQSYDAPAPAAAAPVTEQTFINEGGIKVVLKLSTGHFSGASFLCEVPDEIVITSTNGNISNVEFNVGEYDKSYKCVPAEAIQPASLSELNNTTVTATLPADTAEHVFIKITYGSGLSIQKNFYIGHMLGRRDSVDIPATCTKPSVQEMHYFCKVCDSMYYSYEKQDTKGEPLGHSFTEEFEIESTCNEDGTVIYEKCSRCGYIQLKEGSPSVNKEGHEFELHTEEATCYHDYIEYQMCKNCGVIDPSTVDTEETTVKHDFPGLELGEYTTYTEPTCVGWGYYERHCRNEGCTATDTYNVIYPLGHNWVLDGDYTVAPSCDHEGEGNVKCTRCGATETGHTFPALAHDYQIQTTVEPTCDKAGKQEEVCVNCKAVKPGSKEIPLDPLGHEQDPATVDNDCTTPVKCIRCGEIMVEALEHHFETYQSDNDNHWRVCSNPGCSRIDEKSPHVRPDNVACDTPTKCTECGASLPRGTHNYGNYERENNLNHTRTCKDCGYVLTQMHVYENDDDCTTALECTLCGNVARPAIAQHSFTPWVDNLNGSHTRKCTNMWCKVEETVEHSFGTEPARTVVNVQESCTVDGSYTDVYVCTAEGCGATKQVERTVPAGHKFGDWQVETESTCVAAGRHYRECEVCKFREYKEDPADGHDWEDHYTVDEEATCAKEGSESIHCSKCDATKEDKMIPKTNDHKYGALPSEVIPASCLEPGANIYVCEVCDLEDYRKIEATGHTYGDFSYNYDATCQKNGTMTHECSVCGALETVDDPEHPKTEHLFTDWQPYEGATIDKNATEIAYCDYGCGTSETREVPDSKLHSHTFTNYKIIKEATCLDNAVEQAACDICGTLSEEREVEGSALDHSEGIPTVKTPATCTADAVMQAECERCHITLREWTEEGTALGHSFTNYVYNNDATMDADGTETAVCDNGCGTKDTRPAPGTQFHGHSFTKYEIVKEATCTENAVEQARCDVCGEPSEPREVEGSALGHSFTKYVYNNDATLESDGTETAVCDRGCGAKDTRPAEGTKLHTHIFTNYEIIKEATCTENAVEQARCDVCGEPSEPREVEGSALGHSFTKYVYNNDATLESDGTETAVCDRGCGAKDTRPAEGTKLHTHIFTNYEIIKEATCTENAVEQAKCDVCGALSEEREVKDSALGHSFTKYVYNNDATLESDGTETAVCDNGCGAKDTRTAEGTKLVEPGDVNTDVETEGGAPATALPAADAKALEEEVLTEEDKAAVEKGEEVEIVLAVSGANDTVSESDVKAAEEAAGDYTVAEYLDIELSKKIGATETDIHELKNPITLVITVPEALRATGREFAVVRVHEGKASVLSDLDSDPNTVTFKTDRFSTYALMYLDVTPSVVPWTHYHEAGAWRYSNADHWRNCAFCSTTLDYAPHYFVNGVCSVCGYNFNTGTVDVPTEDEGEQVEIEQPVEGRREVSFIEG